MACAASLSTGNALEPLVRESVLRPAGSAVNATSAMFILEKRFPFEASHCLQHHDSKCSRLHGHSYVLVVEVSTEALVTSGPKKGMVMDFDEIAAVVRPLVEKFLDHQHLNETLETDAPTAEYIAYWAYRKLKPSIPCLSAVTVEETATARAIYRPKPLDSLHRIEHDHETSFDHAYGPVS